MRIKKPQAILLDIEGTTTSVRFVSDTLFPFIRTHLKKFLKENWGKTELMVTIDKLRDCCSRESAQTPMPEIKDANDSNQDAVLKSVMANVLWQMEEKRRNTAIKQLQLLIWVYGYEKGFFRGHVFEDVPICLDSWNKNSIRLFIYSTGMIVAQQLLFSCSTYGNLLPLIENFFDARIGSKSDPESYRKIANQISIPADQILFLTDNTKEASAAIRTGMKSIIVKRPGNKPLNQSDYATYTTINTFEELNFVT